jgi:uncharacterized protein YlxW (UPF0749 family)
MDTKEHGAKSSRDAVGRARGEAMPEPISALLHREVVSDYDSVPITRWTQPWSRPAITGLTTIGALLVGFLLAVGVDAGRNAAEQQDTRRDELVRLVEARQEHTEQLGAQLEVLRAEVAEAEDRAAAGLPALQRRLADLGAAAGLTALRGPGLRVTLADATDACPTGRPEDCRIQDSDLQLAVNALFALGAEAVSVNGERVIATTALRSAGRSVLVNYRVLASPYTVEAIGDPEQLRERFLRTDVARDFGVWKDVYGLGFSVQESSALELPAFAGSVRLRVAQPASEARS